MGKVGEQLFILAGALIGLATVAVLLSKQADTANVITKAFSGFGSAISAATSPITGGGGGSIL